MSYLPRCNIYFLTENLWLYSLQTLYVQTRKLKVTTKTDISEKTANTCDIPRNSSSGRTVAGDFDRDFVIAAEIDALCDRFKDLCFALWRRGWNVHWHSLHSS